MYILFYLCVDLFLVSLVIFELSQCCNLLKLGASRVVVYGRSQCSVVCNRFILRSLSM